MKSAHPFHRLLLLLLACAACGGEETVDISTITNETARQAATEVARESEAIQALDTLSGPSADTIKASQQNRLITIQQALKDSKYATMSDRTVDSIRNAWLVGYSRSCDPAEYKRIKDAMRTDEVMKQWTGLHVDSAVAYHARLVAAKKACESR